MTFEETIIDACGCQRADVAEVIAAMRTMVPGGDLGYLSYVHRCRAARIAWFEVQRKRRRERQAEENWE